MDKKKLLELYDLYAEDVYRLALSYLKIPADAEDIVQNVFFKLAEKKIFIMPGKEKTYLMKMASNMCKNHLKSVVARYQDSYDEHSELQIQQAQMQQADNSALSEQTDVYEVLMGLAPKYRIVLYLYYYEGYSIKEIGKILQLTSSAVSMRMSRGREQMKHVLEN